MRIFACFHGNHFIADFESTILIKCMERMQLNLSVQFMCACMAEILEKSFDWNVCRSDHVLESFVLESKIALYIIINWNDRTGIVGKIVLHYIWLQSVIDLVCNLAIKWCRNSSSIFNWCIHHSGTSGIPFSCIKNTANLRSLDIYIQYIMLLNEFGRNLRHVFGGQLCGKCIE